MTTTPSTSPATTELDSFLEEVKQLAGGGSGSGRGRIVFALDATASRQPTWDTACQLQAEMFREVAAAGGLDVQLVYYRGDDQCAASRWTGDTRHLTKIMTGLMCRAGHTQLRKVLVHAQKETGLLKVGALIFIGDALEEDEDELIPEARELGRLGTPAFMFQEGDNHGVEKVFPRDRQRDPWGLLPVRPRRSAPIGGIAQGGRSLRHWRNGGARRTQGCRRRQAARADARLNRGST
jgi:hypothetical protein